MSAPHFSTFFILVLGLGFIQLTIKLSLFFNFTSDFNQLSRHSSTPFAKWLLAANLFNLTPN
jgi:heme/copper-type cytochrome/quinol oxidase subunit 4